MTLNVQNAKKIGIGGSKNLFDKTMATLDKTLTWAAAADYNSPGSVTGDYMSTSAGTVYSGNYAMLAFFFDANKTYLGNLQPNGSTIGTNTGGYFRSFTVPANYGIVYVRIVFRQGQADNPSDLTDKNLMVNLGPTALPYEAYVAPSEVRAIHDKDSRLLWGRLEYDTKYEGDAWQQTYTGKNIFSFDAGTFSSGNVSQTHTDNTVHMVAVSTTGVQYVRVALGDFDRAKTYHLSCKARKIVKGIDGQPRLRVYAQYSDDGVSWAAQTAANVDDPVQGQEYTISASFSGHPYYRLYFYNNSSTPVTVGEETEYWNIQVEESGTATPFEPYVGGIPAPNPGYPQDIKVVEGPQQVTVYDRNMFDGQMELGVINGHTGQNNPNDSYTRCKNYIPVSENTVYILSSPTFTGSYNVYEYKSDLTFNMVSNKNTQSGIFTTNAGTAFVRFRPGAQITTASLTTKYQLEKGSTATAYVPYHGKTYTFDLRGKNLLGLDAGSLTQSGTCTWTNTTNSIVITASGTTGAQYVTWTSTELDDTKTYTFSGKAKKLVKGTDGTPNITTRYRTSSDGVNWSSAMTINNFNPVQGQEYNVGGTLPSGFKYYRILLYNNTGTPVATGEQTTFYDLQLEAGSTATDFQPYHAPYELKRVGNYADYIYKDGNDWKLKKQVGLMTYASPGDSLSLRNTSAKGTYTYSTTSAPDYKFEPGVAVVSPQFRNIGPISGVAQMYNALLDVVGVALYYNASLTQQALYLNSNVQASTLLANGIDVYYPLATPTDTVITDAALIAQLNAMQEWLTRYGYDHTVVGDLPIVINQESL